VSPRVDDGLGVPEFLGIEPRCAEERFHCRDIAVVGSAVGNEGATHLKEKFPRFVWEWAFAKPGYAFERETKATIAQLSPRV
jgi:hypothetical protein